MNSNSQKESIVWGKWSEDKINKLLWESNKINPIEKRIDFISAQFLGTKYLENTLIGNHNTGEILTINLDGMDCFTFLDYVEALTLSENFMDFKANLI
ncbi:MAG: N-acetylmuramoyl-L-alanine amidase-like domain-containing protein, partial [Thermodesulfobacteriota bacterium]